MLRSQRLPNLIAFTATFVLLGIFLCHSWYGPDIWYHLTWGRAIWDSGRLIPSTQTLISQPIPANIYWLFQLIMFGAFQVGGLYLVSGIYAVTWLSIAVLWLRLSRAYALDWGSVLFLTFIVLCQLRFEQRPEVFSYLFILTMISLLARSKPWPRAYPLVLFGLQILWTSLHSYFPLGVLIAAAYALSTIWSGPRQRRQGVLALLATALGSVATPFGASVWITVWDYSKVGAGLKDLNQELFTPTLWPPSWPLTLLWLWIITVTILALTALRRRDQIFSALLALGGAMLSVQAVRNTPMVTLLSAPLWHAFIAPNHPRLIISKLSQAITIATAMALAFWTLNDTYYHYTGALATWGVHLEWSSYPIGAAEILQKIDFRGRIFCDSYDGGYLEFALPQAHVAGDSYFSDAPITRAYFDAIRRPEALAQLDSKMQFDAFLINIENLEQVKWAISRPNLVMVYNDSHRALFWRRPQPPLLPSWSPTQANYWHGESLKNWAYAFGPISWAALAYDLHNGEMLSKIVQDVGGAESVPAILLRIGLTYALERRDGTLAKQALALLPKMYVTDPRDAEGIAMLKARLEAP